MKLSNIILIFLIIISPFFLMNKLKSMDIKVANYKSVEIKKYIDTSLDDATIKLVSSASNIDSDANNKEGGSNEVALDKDEAIKTFFRTLYVNFGAKNNKTLQRKLQGYIPCVIVIDKNGFYTLSHSLYMDANGYKNTKLVWKPKKYFSYSDGKYIYKLSLDDSVIIYDKNDNTQPFYEGSFTDFLCSSEYTEYINNGGTLKDNTYTNTDTGAYYTAKEYFNLLKQRIITDAIKGTVNFCINNQNALAAQYGITYKFNIPTVNGSDWKRAISDVGMLVFFQGMPIDTTGRCYFNDFALSGARVMKSIKYVEDPTVINGRIYYHKENCSHIQAAESDLIIKDSKIECSKDGYYPCQKCKP